MAALWGELWEALCSAFRSPRYSVPALLSVALGTGASLAVFSVFSALALQPLPFRDPEELVTVGFAGASAWAGPDDSRLSPQLLTSFASTTRCSGARCSPLADGAPAGDGRPRVRGVG